MKEINEAKKTRTFHRRMVFGIGIISTIFAMMISGFGVFNGVESKSIDWRFKARGIVQPKAPVVIVAIDDDSFPRMPERWVWPRTFYVKAIENLNKWGAKVIAFDVVYSEATARNPKEDLEFADAVKKAGNVVLGMAILVQDTKLGQKTVTVYPIDPLKNAALQLGLVHHPFDRDSHIRNTHLAKVDSERGENYYSLALEAYAAYKDIPRTGISIIRERSRVKIGDMTAPNQVFINFAGPPQTFETVSFHKVYSGEGVKPEMFKDKIVLIGATADILHDVFNTPFTESGNMMPGVEIHANVINTIFEESMLSKLPRWQNLLILLGIGIMTSFLMFGIRTMQGLVILGLEIVAYIAASRYFFDNMNLVIDFVNPLFTMVFCYLSISTYKVTVEERENRKIRNVFSKYVSKQVVDQLLKNPDVKLGGEKKTISVMFTDIRGFTAMSEKMDPKQVLNVLNEYLTAMTDIVFENEGTLDKFIGDAVMALYGTPVYYKDHALRAVKTGVAMQKKLDELNEKWTKEGKTTLKIGIGVNTGEVVAGNMGSLKRMEYTVIGDTVNLASRLESLNKDLGTSFLISESTYEHVKDRIKAKKFEGVKVKGKELQLTVYEVLELL